MIDIVTIETPSLGDRTYVATDGQVALIVDPQRDIDRILAEVATRGAAITDVVETHLHNDYVSGGLALARRTGAAYHVNADDRVAFDRHAVADGDEFIVGEQMLVRVLATPGHTFTHLAYVLAHRETAEVLGVFTGGSLLYGSTGRPDLLGAQHACALAAAQHASARRLCGFLPDSAPVFPTHGFGSFCAVSPARVSSSTIGQERRRNPALTLSQEPYVARLLAGLDAYPSYYAHMAAMNASGPGEVTLVPPDGAGSDAIGRRIAAGEWVVDLRQRRAFAAGHVAGSLSFELGSSLATNLGWLIPWGTPLTLLGETRDQVAAAQLELARIGIDQVAAAATGPPESWVGDERLASYPVASFAQLATARSSAPLTVLDVRRRSERASGYIAGALHIPLHELPGRLGSLPDGPIWVHCQAGYRASIAASLLHAAGFTVTAVDDDFIRAAEAGLALAGAGR